MDAWVDTKEFIGKRYRVGFDVTDEKGFAHLISIPIAAPDPETASARAWQELTTVQRFYETPSINHVSVTEAV